MLINDLIVLGRACPEPLRNGRVTVCLAGWSETHGFIRLYPTHPKMGFHRWDIVRVDVEKNERDNRHESWKIVGAKAQWDDLPKSVSRVGRVEDRNRRRHLVYNLRDTCVNVINGAKRSLGIVKPEILKTYFKENPKYSELYQQGLPGFTDLDKYQVKRDFSHEPRIHYRCPEGGDICNKHDQQVLEWGFYEWFRKFPDSREQVWENAGIGQEKTDIYFLVGNQFAYRTSFMVISVLRVPSGPAAMDMFPLKK